VGDIEPERGIDPGGRGIGFAGVCRGKGDCVAWNTAFTEEHAGEKRADQGTAGVLTTKESSDLCTGGLIDEREGRVVELSGEAYQ